jgi:hypothetical protein
LLFTPSAQWCIRANIREALVAGLRAHDGPAIRRVVGRHLEGRQRGCVLLTWSSSSVTAATHSIHKCICCWFLDARLRRVAAFLCMAAPRLRTVPAADAVVPREGSVSVTFLVAGAMRHPHRSRSCRRHAVSLAEQRHLQEPHCAGLIRVA